VGKKETHHLEGVGEEIEKNEGKETSPHTSKAGELHPTR